MIAGSVLKAVNKYQQLTQLVRTKKIEANQRAAAGEKKYPRLDKIKEIGKPKVLKGIQAFSKMFSTVATIGLSPALTTMNMSFASLAEIFNSILTPLQPFFDLLSLIATLLEAALVPLTVALYEGFSSIFNDIGEAIPELMAIVEEYITDNEQLEEIITTVKEGVENLIEALKNGLMEQIVDLVLNLLALAAIMVETNANGKTMVQELIELAIAMTNLLIALKPLMPIIYKLVDAVTALSDAATMAADGAKAIGGNPALGAAAGLTFGLGPAIVGGLLGFDSGGNPQNDMIGQLHSNDIVLAVDDPRTTSALSEAIDMTEMTSKQDMTNDLLVELINGLKKKNLTRR